MTDAKIETVTLYSVMGNSDLNEGRGSHYTKGMYLDSEMARRAATGTYVMGTDCPIEREVKRVVVNLEDGSVHLLGPKITISTETPEELRKRALAKLTSEERAALGFSE